MLYGYQGVVLTEDMEGGGEMRMLLGAVLGTPVYDNDGVMAWNLHDIPLANFSDWAYREAETTEAVEATP